ncbi:ligand-binding sensor domain-containing protein [Olivibacter domesticus]|uniref:Two component regulator propeller n=1 Tax=Olivibacter domesticus TaxID=407022 RepID=A0A1H7ITA8_OLID1|nr:two-component regulator propeller domain-containing protein [Olivibacter domesticus]SEK64025.1 Two component regulator propeller [Olivibacter domesticus]
MKSYTLSYILFLIFIFYTSCTGQNKTSPQKENIRPETKDASTPHGPTTIVRTIKQDRKGNIWIASWDGIFRYDGKSFTNITSKVSSARFFSVLEDKKGNFWFSSVGSGVYYYDGTSFRNFTTKDGLVNDRVSEIYEDRAGSIWFSTEDGASRYDGQSFRSFTTKDGLPHNGVNSIIEDKTGKFWFCTRGGACLYDGKTFTILAHDGKPFRNVHTIIEDKKGNIWLGGNDGLLRYNGSIFINYSENFVGYIYEDKTGNLWTSSNNVKTKNFKNDLPSNINQSTWTLSRYNEKSLFNNAALPELIRTNEGMIFGILETDNGNIWFGTLNGVHRYHGNIITDFKGKVQE